MEMVWPTFRGLSARDGVKQRILSVGLTVKSYGLRMKFQCSNGLRACKTIEWE